MEITYTHPDMPEGHEFGIIGLGVLKNGESLEVDEAMERAFISAHGMTLAEAMNGQEAFSLSGSAVITDISDVLPAEISDRPSKDPTAMNLTADGEVFEHANLAGAITPVEEVETEETLVTEAVGEDAPTPTTTTSQVEDGGEH